MASNSITTLPFNKFIDKFFESDNTGDAAGVSNTKASSAVAAVGESETPAASEAASEASSAAPVTSPEAPEEALSASGASEAVSEASSAVAAVGESETPAGAETASEAPAASGAAEPPAASGAPASPSSDSTQPAGTETASGAEAKPTSASSSGAASTAAEEGAESEKSASTAATLEEAPAAAKLAELFKSTSSNSNYTIELNNTNKHSIKINDNYIPLDDLIKYMKDSPIQNPPENLKKAIKQYVQSKNTNASNLSVATKRYLFQHNYFSPTGGGKKKLSKKLFIKNKKQTKKTN